MFLPSPNEKTRVMSKMANVEKNVGEEYGERKIQLAFVFLKGGVEQTLGLSRTDTWPFEIDAWPFGVDFGVRRRSR